MEPTCRKIIYIRVCVCNTCWFHMTGFYLSDNKTESFFTFPLMLNIVKNSLVSKSKWKNNIKNHPHLLTDYPSRLQESHAFLPSKQSIRCHPLARISLPSIHPYTEVYFKYFRINTRRLRRIDAADNRLMERKTRYTDQIQGLCPVTHALTSYDQVHFTAIAFFILT